MILVFLGPPGSGKGTQSDMVSEKISLPVVATGELLRHEQNIGSRVGKKIAKLMDAGSLVPDILVYRLLKKRTKQPDAQKGFLIDGFPRRQEQFKHLVKLIKKSDQICAINVEVSDQEVKKRIGDRRVCDCGAAYHLKYKPTKKPGICDECGKKVYIRNDDKPTVVTKRLKDYHQRSQPILNYFDKHYKLITINGEQSINQVFADIMKAIKQLKK